MHIRMLCPPFLVMKKQTCCNVLVSRFGLWSQPQKNKASASLFAYEV